MRCRPPRRFPGDAPIGELKSNKRRFFRTGIHNEKIIDDERRRARPPFHLGVGVEFLGDVLLPANVAGLRIEDVQIAESAERDDETVVDERRCARGIAVVDRTRRLITERPLQFAGFGIESVEDVERVPEFAVGVDDDPVVGGDSGQAFGEGRLRPGEFRRRRKGFRKQFGPAVAVRTTPAGPKAIR